MTKLLLLLTLALPSFAQTMIGIGQLGCVAIPIPQVAIVQPFTFGFTKLTCVGLDPASFTLDLTDPKRPMLRLVASTAGPKFTDKETPAGVVDGVNVTFTLTTAPNPAASLNLFRNGILQKETLDYNLAGSTITFVAAAIPQQADILLASYRR